MRSAVSITLIIFLLVGQMLIAAPHLHEGACAEEHAGHAAQPHFHLHGAVHHAGADHGDHCHHTSQEQTASESSEHDGDAVYLVDVDLSHDSGSTYSLVSAISLMGFGAVALSGRISDQEALGPHNWSSINLQRPKCALYLRLLSIRC